MDRKGDRKLRVKVKNCEIVKTLSTVSKGYGQMTWDNVSQWSVVSGCDPSIPAVLCSGADGVEIALQDQSEESAVSLNMA